MRKTSLGCKQNFHMGEPEKYHIKHLDNQNGSTENYDAFSLLDSEHETQ